MPSIGHGQVNCYLPLNRTFSLLLLGSETKQLSSTQWLFDSAHLPFPPPPFFPLPNNHEIIIFFFFAVLACSCRLWVVNRKKIRHPTLLFFWPVRSATRTTKKLRYQTDLLCRLISELLLWLISFVENTEEKPNNFQSFLRVKFKSHQTESQKIASHCHTTEIQNKQKRKKNKPVESD